MFLVFVSTTLFTIIKDSINQLWNIKTVEKHGIVFLLKFRAKSFAIILLTGILFLVVFLTESFEQLLGDYFTEIWGRSNAQIENFVNELISLVVVSIWFAVIFRYLPDKRPNWKVAFTGGFFTGLLFTGGKLLLNILLSYSNMQTIYGASTYMVLLLLFVFYSSFIFYYGACFTRVWAEYVRQPIAGRKVGKSGSPKKD